MPTVNSHVRPPMIISQRMHRVGIMITVGIVSTCLFSAGWGVTASTPHSVVHNEDPTSATCTSKCGGVGSEAAVVEVHRGALVVHWADAGPNDTTTLPSGWLRERCTAPESVHTATNQPSKRYHDLTPEAIEIESAAFSAEGDLEVVFLDGHKSRFNSEALQADIESPDTAVVQPSSYQNPGRVYWGADLITPPTFQFDELTTDDAKFKVVTQLLTAGICLIKGVTPKPGTVVKLANMLSVTRETDWGTPFNVQSQSDTGGQKDLAYSSEAVGFHTDNPYRHEPPAYQLLHALEHCSCPDGATPPCDTCGVVNYAVDGFHVAEQLRLEDPEGFDLLCTVVVRFENNGANGSSAYVRSAPVIELELQVSVPATDSTGNQRRKIKAINFSSKSGGYAPLLDATVAAKYYKARRRFSELLDSPKNRIALYLEKGTAWVFDNQRVLHARGPMGANDGPRHLQGAYMDRGMLLFNFELWRRARAAAINPTAPSHRMTAGGKFHSLVDGTHAEYVAMGKVYKARVDAVASQTLLRMFDAQRGDLLGQPIDLHDHGLQTASRALRGGESEELVVVSLIHDLTESVLSKNHGAVMAALLAPWISPQSQWLLEHHEEFQGKYYFHHFGVDPNLRDRWAEHPHFNHTVRWCEEYDQASFDPTYPALPLTVFVPMLERVLNKSAYWWDPTHPNRFAVTGAD